MRTAIFILMMAVQITMGALSPTAAYEYDIEACRWDCRRAKAHHRCMSRCLDERASPPPFADPYIPKGYRPQRGGSFPGRPLCALLLELIVRFLPELLSGFLGVVALMARSCAKRRRALRVAQDLDHKADVFRALADAIRKQHL